MGDSGASASQTGLVGPSDPSPDGLGHSATIPSADWRDACDLEGVRWPVSGFAPGHYMGRCRVCGDTVVNIDKRASQCLRCAINSLASAFEGIDRAFRIRVWNDAKRSGLSDRAAMEKITEARAQAMETRRAETACGLGAQHDSAVPQGCAQHSGVDYG